MEKEFGSTVCRLRQNIHPASKKVENCTKGHFHSVPHALFTGIPPILELAEKYPGVNRAVF